MNQDLLSRVRRDERLDALERSCIERLAAADRHVVVREPESLSRRLLVPVVLRGIAQVDHDADSARLCLLEGRGVGLPSEPQVPEMGHVFDAAPGDGLTHICGCETRVVAGAAEQKQQGARADKRQ